MDFQRISHLEWARHKIWSCRYDLSSSGVPSLLAEGQNLPAPAPLSLAVGSCEGYGYPPLQEILSRRYGVSEDHILLGAGTSLVNFLVMAALLRPGDEVLVEHPAYEPLWEVPRALGATVVRFPRPMKEGFVPDHREVKKLVTPRTRLMVISNLHNPSGAPLPRESLVKLGTLAREHGFHVLVDEVYLDFVLAAGEGPGRLAAALLGPEMITSASLTKVYGLGGLRAGWAVADPALVARIYRVADYLGGSMSEPSARLACGAFRMIEDLARASVALCSKGREIFTEWAATRDDIRWVPPEGGIVVWVELPTGIGSRELYAHLARHYDTVVTPGEFFDSPGYLRLGLGIPPDDLREALSRLGCALDDVKPLAASPDRC